MAFATKNRTDPKPIAHRGPEKGSAVGWLLSVIVLLILIGIVIFAIYNRHWRTDKADGSQVREALASLKGASQDAVTTSKVKTALALSKHVSAFDINVDTSDGIVTLRGRVPSQQTRRIAEEITRDTAGVKQVRNQLTADSSTRPNPEMARLGTRVSDLELRTRLKDLYEKEQTLKDDEIKTDVRDGIVRLEGEVDSPAEKQTAESRAWRMGDVKRVDNNLRVRGGVEGEQPRDELARRVEFELYSSRAFDLEPIQIRSDQGIVILQGQVRSDAEKLLAEKLAKEVDGVKGVRNNLSVTTTTPQTAE
ncbi:MAG: BON domain-containing protein [Acidobacteriota bacterium]